MNWCKQLNTGEGCLPKGRDGLWRDSAVDLHERLRAKRLFFSMRCRVFQRFSVLRLQVRKIFIGLIGNYNFSRARDPSTVIEVQTDCAKDAN